MRGVLLAIALLICAQPLRAAAQSPGPAQLEKIKPDRLGKFGQGKPRPWVDPGPLLYLAADSVTEDIDRKHVVMQGKVEIYYNNYILTADKMVLDRHTNKLTAEGKAQIKAPDGRVIRDDRMEAADDLREALAKMLAKSDCANNPRCMAPALPEDCIIIWAANLCVPKVLEHRPEP